jgi:integrase
VIAEDVAWTLPLDSDAVEAQTPSGAGGWPLPRSQTRTGSSRARERQAAEPDRWWNARWKAALAGGDHDYVRPFHDARHSSLTHQAAAGSSPIAIMAGAGHASMATTKHYLHLAGVVFKDEAAALEERLLGAKR